MIDLTPIVSSRSFFELRTAAMNLGLEETIRSTPMEEILGGRYRSDLLDALELVAEETRDGSLDELLRRADVVLRGQRLKGPRRKLLKAARQHLVTTLRRRDAEPRAVDAWATKLGVEDWLDRPVKEAEDEHGYPLSPYPLGRTVRGLLEGTATECFRGEADELRRFLEREAEDRKLALREEKAAGLMTRPLPEHPPFAQLTERLRRVRKKLREEVRPRSSETVRIHQLSFSDGVPITVLLEEQRRRHTIGPLLLEVSVPLTLDRDPVPVCSECKGPCDHARVLIDQILCKLLGIVEEDRALRFLRENLGRPPWERALEAVGALSAELDAGTGLQDPRLWWCFDEDGYHLDPYVQSRGKRGTLTKPKKRTPFNVPEEALVDPRDREVLAYARLLKRATNQEESDGAFVSGMRGLVGHPRVALLGTDFEPWSIETARPEVVAQEAGDELELRVALNGEAIDFEALRERFEERSIGFTAFMIDREKRSCRMFSVEDPTIQTASRIHRYCGSRIPAEARPALLSSLGRLSAHVPVVLPEGASRPVDARSEPIALLSMNGNGGIEISLRVCPLEGGAFFMPGEGPPLAVAADDKRDVKTARRDLPGEIAQARGLESRLGVKLDDAWRAGAETSDAIASLLTALRSDDVECRWPSGTWRKTTVGVEQLGLRVTPGRDWFGLEGGIEVDGHRVSLAVLLEAARAGRIYVRVPGDTLAILEKDLVERLAEIEPLTSTKQERVEVSPAAASLLGDVHAPETWNDLKRRIEAAGRVEPEVPASLEAELRPYQKEGHRWMSRLAAWSAGGVLADDMGLGKTVQTLAMLLERSGTGPQLVVAPTSVCFNWVREMERFAPGLRPVPYVGTDRGGLLEGLGPKDVVITSYGLLTRDLEVFEQRSFATMVLDEAQAVKNPGALRTRAVRRVDADWRVALTGTPIENRLAELWSIFRVVFPALLGSWDHFRDRFLSPHSGGAGALAKVIRPFVLRRTKMQVASELPPRTEITIDVALSKKERALYEDVRLATIVHLAKLETELPSEQIRFHVLSAITRLRQLCCHPRLHDADSKVPSSKLDRLLHIVGDLVEEGRRALVFSQFTSNLGLVRDALVEKGIPFLYLDGGTPAAERGGIVDRFQAGEAQIFLLSLKAGGTGLNLTAADTVIHLDPWWNPAVEDQATDRAHRIGQTKPVTVLRLVTRGTIEEQILALHEDKRDLMRRLLDGADRAGALSSDEMMEMIRAGFAGTAFEPEEEEPAIEGEPSVEDRLEAEVESGRLKKSTAAAYLRVARRVRSLGVTSVEEAIHAYGEAIDAGRFPKSDRAVVRPAAERLFS